MATKHIDCKSYDTVFYNYESMVSLVLRQYMRGENGTESLVGFFSVLLIRIGKQNVKIIEK